MVILWLYGVLEGPQSYGYPYGKSYGYFMVIWGFGRTPFPDHSVRSVQRFCHSVRGLPFCTRAGMMCFGFVVAQQTSAGLSGFWRCRERARRYSLPDLPRGDQLPAFLARSARPWQTPRHRRARVRRTPCAHMQCPALPPPAGDKRCAGGEPAVGDGVGELSWFSVILSETILVATSAA